MKNMVFVGMVLGFTIGAIGVSLCRPAQNFIKNSAEAIKEEAEAMIKKNSKN